MDTMEILNEMRNGALDLKMRYELLEDRTLHKIDVLNQIFEDTSFGEYVADGVKIVKMFYKDKMTIEEIAEKMYMCDRTIYRRRDQCVRWLQRTLDNT